MENRGGDRFASGFIAGAIFGSIAGAFAAVFLTNKLAELSSDESDGSKPSRQLGLGDREAVVIENARQGLEAKIAQLNEAVDDLQQRLSTVPESIES